MNKDNLEYIDGILEEMSESELNAFEARFSLLNKKQVLRDAIHQIEDEELLNDIYSYMRGDYWSQ